MKYLMVAVVGVIVTARIADAQDGRSDAQRIDGYQDFHYGRIDHRIEQWVQAIQVSEPQPRSEVRGDVPVRFRAAGMTEATAWCWQQAVPPNRWGVDANLTPDGIPLSTDGVGAFLFPAEQFPHGPVNVRIYAHNGKYRKDIFELQLFNLGGVVWNQGIPDADPPCLRSFSYVVRRER